MTLNIKGKNYMMVNERIKLFREKFPNYLLETEIINLTEDFCTLKTVIKNENGVIVSTGLAQEYKNDKESFVNLNAYVENCETSAVGRALGMLGIGIDVAIASADEMQTKTSYPHLETFDDFENAIKEAKNVKRINSLWYQWKEKFSKESEEYKKLNKISSDCKLQLENPELNIKERN